MATSSILANIKITEPKMNQYTVMNILDLIDSVVKNEVQKVSPIFYVLKFSVLTFVQPYYFDVFCRNLSNLMKSLLNAAKSILALP